MLSLTCFSSFRTAAAAPCWQAYFPISTRDETREEWRCTWCKSRALVFCSYTSKVACAIAWDGIDVQRVPRRSGRPPTGFMYRSRAIVTNILLVVDKFSPCLIFVVAGHRRNIFNDEKFPIYDVSNGRATRRRHRIISEIRRI